MPVTENNLILAVSRCDPAAVRLCLDAGADLQATDECGRTALHVSALNCGLAGQLEIAGALLHAGADVRAEDPDGRTAEDLAIKRLRWMRRRFKVRDETREHARLNANEKRVLDDARVLAHRLLHARRRIAVREADPRLGLRGADGRTGLHWAAEEGDEALVGRWIERGGELAVYDHVGFTPALRAAQAGHAGVLRKLVAHDPNWWEEHRTSDGQHAVLLAVQSGSAAAVQVLAEAASDAQDAGARELFNDHDDRDWAPLDRAVESNAVEIARILVNAGADPDLAQNNATHPLDHAVRKGLADMCAVLLEGSKAIRRLDKGRAVLRSAIESGSPETVAAVLKANPELAKPAALPGEQPEEMALARLEEVREGSPGSDAAERAGRIHEMVRNAAVASQAHPAAGP